MSFLSRLFRPKAVDPRQPQSWLKLRAPQPDGSEGFFMPDEMVPSHGHNFLALSSSIRQDIVIVNTHSRTVVDRINARDHGVERHLCWLDDRTLVYCAGTVLPDYEDGDPSSNLRVDFWSVDDKRVVWSLDLHEQGIFDVDAVVAFSDRETLLISAYRPGSDQSTLLFVNPRDKRIDTFVNDDGYLSVEQMITLDDGILVAGLLPGEAGVHVSKVVSPQDPLQILASIDQFQSTGVKMHLHRPTGRLLVANADEDDKTHILTFQLSADALRDRQEHASISQCFAVSGFLDGQHVVYGSSADTLPSMLSVVHLPTGSAFAFSPGKRTSAEQFVVHVDDLWVLAGDELFSLTLQSVFPHV